MIIFIVPKNSGLAICKDISKEYSGEILEVRGEDVPLFVAELLSQNKKVIGITGEDLFKEFSLKNKEKNLEIVKRIVWDDEKCIFEKPTLCLMGSKNKKLESLPKKIRVCINRKYQKLTNKYCINGLISRGYEVEKIYVSGCSEEMFSEGLVDLVVDIVYSGKSAEEAGLGVYEKIFSSDIIVIGCKEVIENGK